MNENRMITSNNIGEVSLPPAHEAGWRVKVRAKHRGGSETHVFGEAKWIEIPSVGRTIAKTTGTLNLNHEHRVKWEIPINMKALKKAVTFAVRNPPRIRRIPAITAKILKLDE